MLINVNQVLKNFDGKVINDRDSEGNIIETTLKLVIANALLTPANNDQGVDKIKKYELAKSIYMSESEVDLSLEDITLIKKLVGDVYTPLIVGQVFELLKV